MRLGRVSFRRFGMDININYLLVESNRVKLGGYETISEKFLNNLVDSLYSDIKPGQFLKSKYHKLSRGGYLQISGISGMIHRDKRLLTSEESRELSKIYLKAYTDDNYAELVFILFITGCVNTKDLLCKFTDISFIVSKFSKRPSMPKLRINSQGYRDLMACLIENTSSGIDYGYCVYDFVYHICKSAKLPNTVLACLKTLKLVNASCFSVCDKKVLDKYKEEISYMLPLIVDRGCINGNDLVYVLSNVPYGIQIRVLSDKMFLNKTHNICVEVM